MSKNKNQASNPSELIEELRSLIAEAEKVMSDTVVEPTTEVVNTLRERFRVTQERLSEIYADTKRQVVAGAHYTDEAIREHPYPSIAVAVGVGALIGVVVGRRCCRQCKCDKGRAGMLLALRNEDDTIRDRDLPPTIAAAL